MRPESVSKTQTTRTPVEAPTTLPEFLVLMLRGYDEGPAVSRSGERPRGQR